MERARRASNWPGKPHSPRARSPSPHQKNWPSPHGQLLGGRGAPGLFRNLGPQQNVSTHRGSTRETTELAKKFIPVFFPYHCNSQSSGVYTECTHARTHTHIHTHIPYLPSLLEEKGSTSVNFQTSFKRCFGSKVFLKLPIFKCHLINSTQISSHSRAVTSILT